MVFVAVVNALFNRLRLRSELYSWMGRRVGVGGKAPNITANLWQ